MIKPLAFTLVFVLSAILEIQAGSDCRANTLDTLDTALNTNDPVLARGKGFEIRWHEVDQVLATAKAANPQDELPADAEIHVIEQLIEIQLVLQKASDAEKEEGKQIADQKFASIVNALKPVVFEHRLQATHTTAVELRRKFYQDETSQISLARQLRIEVTDADAKRLYDSQPPGSYDHPAMARVRELLLLTDVGFSSDPLPAATVQAKHQLIFELYKRVQAGEDFAALAKQYNEDPVSKSKDGEFSFRRTDMEFGDLAFSMQTNQITGVLTNEDGYRFFQLIEIIPVKKIAYADIADTLKKVMTRDQARSLAPAYIRQLWQEAGVEILDPKLKAAVTANEAEAAEAARAQTAFETNNAPPAKP